jgi:predicted hydrocarbon binding protein
MFGYVLVDKPSLRIREYDYYRATYCGLCHAMGKCTGCLSRMSLSYDITFFALLREMLDGTEIKFTEKRCIRHPIKKIQTVDINSQLEYSAYISGILSAGKIADNLADEKGAKVAVAKLCWVLFSKMRKKSSAALPEMFALISQKLDELLFEVEEKRVASIDVPANIFGDMMGELLSYGLENEKKIIAKNIGYRLGRWIYIVDAFDDYEKDRKSGSYNPFVLLYGANDFSDEDFESISKMLEAELALAFSALELLDEDKDKNRSEIIKNILCMGMPASVKRVCDKKTKTDR